jgi:hypothetical protein
MERNPAWLIPALLAASAVGGAAGWAALTSGSSTPTAEELEAAQRSALAERLRAQMALDQFSSALSVAIPVMLAGGAFLLWKSRSVEEVVP